MTIKLKVAKATFILICASIAGHSLGFFKEIMIANYFGVSRLIDSYYVALTIPNIINNILLAPFAVIFIPIFIKYRIKNKIEADEIASVFINYLMVFLLLFTVILFYFAPHIIKLFFGSLEPERSFLAIKILRVLCIMVIFTGVTKVATGILNALESFALPAFSQMLITLSTITFIVFFYNRFGIFVLPLGLATGLALWSFALIAQLKYKGYNHSFKFNTQSPAIKEMLNFSALFVVLSVLSQVGVLINRIIASYLPSGSIAAIEYANKIMQVPLIIFSGSISTAVYPFFSLQIAEDKIEALKDTFASSIKTSALIFIPMAIVIIIFSKGIIQVVFERGAFDAAATVLTSKILILFAFQLFAYYIVAIMMKLFFALQDFKSILYVNLINIPVLIALNLLFIRIINPPAAGIALATSVGFFINSIICFIFLKKRLVNVHGASIFMALLKIGAISVISGILMHLIYNWLGSKMVLTLINRLIAMGSAFLAGSVFFIVAAFAIKLEEMRKIYNLGMNKLKGEI
ncbi:MAG: murein biosynthesis integral membrane protein MurJ [Elusimicrobia bacterium]|nr:murein biosynthesis integral membrane protein MurJ [Candidatus Liberimonas magnetica]